jgi:hypothetical protein
MAVENLEGCPPDFNVSHLHGTDERDHFSLSHVPVAELE